MGKVVTQSRIARKWQGGYALRAPALGKSWLIGCLVCGFSPVTRKRLKHRPVSQPRLRRKWRRSWSCCRSPTVVDDVVYFGSGGGNLYAVDAVNGTVLWGTTIDSVYASTPAVVNGVVYAGSYSGGVFAVNAQTGTILWKYSTNGSTVAPAVANGVVYAGSWDNNLYALNAATGALLWKYPTGGFVTCTPAVENGVVYLGSNGGALEALNAATGTRLWSFSSGACYGSSPTVANGVVYIGGNNSVYAVRADTGAPLWSYTTGNAILSSPTVADGVVYIGSWDEHVYAFGLPRSASVEKPDRPDLKTLRPNFDLKVSGPNATPSEESEGLVMGSQMM
jgi:outer membrane protein assembly factor BamB